MTRWLTFAFLLFLTGCSEKCVQSGVEGVYTMTSGATEYKLQLLSGGGGTLSSANRQIGKLSWSFVSGPQRLWGSVRRSPADAFHG